MFSSSSSLVDTRNRDKRSLLLGRQPRRSGSFARMDSVESNLTARSPSIEDLKCFEAPKHPKIQMRSPQRKQNGYARKNNGFAPSTAASSLDSWYQEHMMSGGHSTAAAWPDHAALAPAPSPSVPAYNWTRQRFERFHVEPRAGGNYALVDRLQAEQARQRALLEQGLLGPSASQLVLQGQLHLAANAAEVGRACTDLLGHVMSTVSNFWPFAAAPDAGSSNSTLNPNARSFTPSAAAALNPNAKEFTPKEPSPQPVLSNSQSTSLAKQQPISDSCSTPDIRLDSCDEASSVVRTPENALLGGSGLKPVAERKCTPYAKSHPVSPEVPPAMSDVSATSINGCEVRVERGNEKSDGEDDVGAVIIAEDPDLDGHSTTGGKAEPQPRLRNQSSCSSDCSFIEFDREDVDDHPDDEEEEADEEEDEDDSDYDDDFDDSDWDDDLDDSATGRCVVVDLADFADLGPSFTCPIIERKNSTSSSLSSSSGGHAASAEDVTDSACIGGLSLSAVERFYPESDETAEERRNKSERLRRANERFRDAYGDEKVTFVEGCEGEEDCNIKSKVRFSAPETWAVHLEDPALSAELKEARVSDFIRRQSDRERLARIISPVLESKHRKAVFERLYSASSP